ncbi:putative ribonuclease H-like domain-containing protein [Tanacetum coccineum]|uniref:Ribonuclease H-like domain-containing protein n=1 Tax=Tanacetum coccineum TaxID=301880 RepID=A0ABQ5C3V2_9ASTR
MNHQNQFVPKAGLTRTGKIPVNTTRASGTNTVNTARHNFNRQAVPTNATRKVNNVKPIMINARPKVDFINLFHLFRKSLFRTINTFRTNFQNKKVNTVMYPQRALQNKEIVDSGRSRHIQMCDKKNKVLFTDTECLVLSLEFKLPDENQVLLRIPRQNNMYSFNLENIVPSGVKISEAKNEGAKPTKDPGLKTNEEPDFAQSTEMCLLQAGAAKANHTNTVNIVRTPVSTTSSSDGPSFPNLTNYPDQDDSQIPALEDIYGNSNDDIFTNAFYDDEGAKILKALEDESWVDATAGRTIANSRFISMESGHRQEEGIDYDEVFAPVARIEAIRIFLAFASYMEFIVYQMDVKSAFLYDTINEEVYVSQPLGFVEPSFHQKVLQGLRGTIDKTLFIKKDKNDIMLVQVYVDDIIFGSTKRSWCDEFEALMKNKVCCKKILKKFDFANGKTASTPIETQKPLTKDEEAADVDVHLYRSMIVSLMYLTTSRPDIMFAVCACSRVSSFDLEAYSDSDYAGANLDRKSTLGGCQFLGMRLISWQCKKQTIWITISTEITATASTNAHEEVKLIASIDGQVKTHTKHPKKKTSKDEDDGGITFL